MKMHAIFISKLLILLSFLIIIASFAIVWRDYSGYRYDYNKQVVQTVPGELIVKFLPKAIIREGDFVEVINPEIQEILLKYGLINIEPVFNTVVPERELKPGLEPLDLSTIMLLRFPKESNIKEIMKALKMDDIIYVEPNYLVELCPDKVQIPDTLIYEGPLSLYPNDPQYPQQDNLHNIDIKKAWDIEEGKEHVVVAVVDTGVDISHEDLKDNIWINISEDINFDGELNNLDINGHDDDSNGYPDDFYGWNFYDKNNNVSDPDGHGTHIAGIIAAVANNGKGIAGISWRSKIMPCRVSGSEQNSRFPVSKIVKAIKYATDNNADIINCSFGSRDRPFRVEVDVLQYAYEYNVILIVAAGNDAIDATAFSPASIPYVMTVSSFKKSPYDAISAYSNFGIKLDVAAYGTVLRLVLLQGNFPYCDRAVRIVQD